MSHSDFHKIFVISLRSFVALFAFVSAGAEAASWAYIESVEINRSSNIVSIYSFKRGMYPIGETGPGTNFVDQLSQIYLYNVYATVTVKNDGDENFNGSLIFREKGAKDYRSSEGPFNLPPHTNKRFILRIPCSVVQGPGLHTFHLDLVKGFWIWERQTIDVYPITLDIRNISPNFDGPVEDELGETVLFSTAVERDTDELVDALISTGNFFCMLVPPHHHECFEGAGEDTLVKLALAESIKDTPNIILKGSSLNPQNYYRDLEISWRDKISSIHGAYVAYEVFLNYDRAVIILKLPEEVGFISASPQPDKNYVNNQKRILIWIINGVDKSIEPSHVDNTISIRVQEPYSFQYTAAASLMLQFGPFEDKIGLSNLRNRPPKYDYTTWETNPGETVWLTVASATDKDTFSTRFEDLGYNPIFTGFPYDLVPDYGATPQINLNFYLNNDLLPAYVSQLTFESVGYGNIEVEINQSNQTADIILPPDWKGEEKIDFIVRDDEGRTDIGSIWINSIIPTSLQNGQVTPASGTKDDLYTFSVTYRNPDNTYPKRALVIINEIPQDMKKKSGSPAVKDGAIFEYTGKLSTSNNQIYFEFGDDQIKYRHPEDDVLYGPNIAELHDIAVRNFNIYPEEPRAGDIVEVRTQIENMGTQNELNISIVFKVDGVIQDSREINVPVDETSQVLIFSYQIPISDDTENYDLKVEAVPVTGESNIADNIESRNLTIIPEPGAISGWVFDEWNNPVEDAIVKVIESDVDSYGSTDADGYYFLDGLMPGNYTLEAYKPGEGKGTLVNIPVHSQQTTANRNFILYPSGTQLITSGKYLSFNAWSPDGSQIALSQYLEIEGETYPTLTVTNEDGSGFKRYTGPDKDVLEGEQMEWSPDGTYIFFNGYKSPEGYRGVWRVSSAGTGTDAIRIIDGNTGNCGFSLSPDGDYIAYTGVHDNEIWRVTKTGTNATQLSNTGRGHGDIAWSPDDTKIAFTSINGTLWIFNIADGTEYKIRDSVTYSPSWLPDSSGILFNFSGGIWVHYLDSGEEVKITYDPEQEECPSIWPRKIPPESDWKIAYVSNKGFIGIGERGLFKMPFTAPSLYFIGVTAQPDPFTPNDDGVNDILGISYTLSKDAHVTLKMHDSQGKYVATVLDNDFQTKGTHIAEWDGRNQEGNKENSEVYFYRLDMHDATEVAIPAHGRISMMKDIRQIGNDVSYPRWSPNGSKVIYFNETDKSMYICDAPDCLNSQLINTPYDVGVRPFWYPDGQKIAFPSYSDGPQGTKTKAQIAKINVDGTGYTDLTHYTPGGLMMGKYPCVSPSGNEIVFSGYWWEDSEHRYWYICKMNADGSNIIKLGDYRIAQPIRPAAPVWSPDGSTIAYASDKTGDNNVEIYLMAEDGSWEEQLTNNPYLDYYPEFTSDGSRLLFTSSRHGAGADLWTMPLDDSDRSRCLVKDYRYGMPSPSGDMILVENHVLELFLSLTKGAIEGRILEHDTLQPIANATVYLYQNDSLLDTTLTNTHGGYQFYNLQPGEYELNAEAESYIKSDDMTVQTHSWVVARDNNIELKHQPSVIISELSDGKIIGSIVAINIEKQEGDVAYVNYQYRKDEEEWQDIETTLYPLPAEFDTNDPNLNLSSGNYQIRAVALDNFGDKDSTPDVINIEIDHTSPSATITSPTNGSEVYGTVSIVAFSSDSDIDSVLFQYREIGDILWVNIGSVDSGVPWLREWKTDHLIEGEYELRAQAIDSLGNADNNPEIIVVHGGAYEQPIVVLSWYSAKTHSCGEGLLEIPNDGTFSEPRLAGQGMTVGGIGTLLVTFSNAIDPSSLTPDGVQVCGLDVNEDLVDLSGISISTNIRTGVETCGRDMGETIAEISFTPALPDYARYLVRLSGITDVMGNPLVGDNDRIMTALLGDATGDLRVNNTDVGGVKSLRGINPIDLCDKWQVRSDVTLDCRINNTDVGGVKSVRGRDARFIPDPDPVYDCTVLYGMSYGPFRLGQQPGGVYPSLAQIDEDLAIIKSMVAAVRTYGIDNTLGSIPAKCYGIGLNCYIGCWLSGDYGIDSNTIADMVDIGNAGYSTNKALLVGNEYVYQHFYEPGCVEYVTNWIDQVEAATTDIPVTTAEPWHVWRDKPDLAASVDIIAMHVYGYWEGDDIDDAAQTVVDKYHLLQNLYPDKEVVIFETGWPTQGDTFGSAVPNDANQQQFLEDFVPLAEAENIKYFIFEAFDEPWKETASGVEAEGHWGLYYENRTIKPGFAAFANQN